MSLERYVSVKKKNWRKISFSSKHAVIVSICTMCFLFGLNIHLLVTDEFSNSTSNSSLGSCSWTLMGIPNWRQVSKFFCQ